MDNHILLQATFCDATRDAIVDVWIIKEGIVLIKHEGLFRKIRFFSISDIVGCDIPQRVLNTRRNVSTSGYRHSHYRGSSHISRSNQKAVLHIFVYLKECLQVKTGQKRRRFILYLTFDTHRYFDENIRHAEIWEGVIVDLLNQNYRMKLPKMIDEDNSNKMLVLLNPRSGPGKCRQIFRSKVEPVLREARIDFDLYVTSEKNDARKLMRTCDTSQWENGLLVIGGDGLLHEVINGIMERKDWKETFSKLCFGIIPAGSGNGLAKSICFAIDEPYDNDPALVSILNVVKGVPTMMDLVRVETQSEVLYSFLSIGWGFIADVDIDSEPLRCIGSPRFTLWSIARIIKTKVYSGRLSFARVADERVKLIRKSSHCENAQTDKDMFEAECESPRIRVTGSTASDKPIVSAGMAACNADNDARCSSISDMFSKSEKVPTYGPYSELPSLRQPVPSHWEVYQGDFILIHACYQSHLGETAFFAPDCKIDDGIIWLVVIKAGISRRSLFHCLLGLSTGEHVNVPGVEIIPVTAFRLEPLTDGSYLVVDGELINLGPVQAEIFPRMMPIYQRNKSLFSIEDYLKKFSSR